MARFAEWCPELEAALAAPFPSEWHKTKSQGGASITFVEWHRYAATLNELVGPQGWEVRLRFHDVGGKLVTVTGLSILGVLKENVGDEDEDKDSYGTACTNSFAQSYKRAAALFGLGLYMYDKAGRESATRSQRRAPNPPQSAVQGNGPPPHVMEAFDLEVDPSEPVPSCPKCDGAMWDNRTSKRSPKAPDFKCKDKGCDGALWKRKKAATA